MQGFGSQNKETLVELCASFFRFWAREFNYVRDAVSVRLGRIISKASKDWNRRVGTERHLLGVEVRLLSRLNALGTPPPPGGSAEGGAGVRWK